MIIYIYSYINKKTNNRYIGKTNDIARRKREHESGAFNVESSTYNTMWSKKIRQYGMDAFDFVVLEEVNENNWKEREIYWISYYNSFMGAGYNTTAGGDSNENLQRSLAIEESKEVIQMLYKNYSVLEISMKFNISETLISNINQGQKYVDSDISYPIRKRYRDSSEYDELVFDLKNTTTSMLELSKKHKISEATVKKINYGTLRPELSDSYPIRKVNGVVQKANIVKDLLTYSEHSFQKTVELAGVSIRTVNRINIGETHFDSLLSYPLRKTCID